MENLTKVLALKGQDEKREIFLITTQDADFRNKLWELAKQAGNIITLTPSEYALLQALQRLQKERDALEELTTIDPQTGLFNKKFFLHAIEWAMELTLRTKYPFIINLSEIKGNESLEDKDEDLYRKVGNILKQNLRKVDITAHFGNGRYGIILMATKFPEGLIVVERLVHKVKEELGLDIHFGAFVYRGGRVKVETLLSQAENALKHAQRTASESVCCFDSFI
ncbi:MAG: diguanylate cyclase [Candidatus Desulfofervidaceae bacterium]|nr:diguanylate cyclase [Candidatus Desulfofervidaceae bacterium]